MDGRRLDLHRVRGHGVVIGAARASFLLSGAKRQPDRLYDFKANVYRHGTTIDTWANLGGVFDGSGRGSSGLIIYGSSGVTRIPFPTVDEFVVVLKYASFSSSTVHVPFRVIAAGDFVSKELGFESSYGTLYGRAAHGGSNLDRPSLGPTPSDGKIAGALSAGLARFCVNGGDVETGEIERPSNWQGDQLNIGNSSAGGGQNWTGNIELVEVYFGRFSPSQIQAFTAPD